MVISTYLKPLIYRNLDNNTGPGLKHEFVSDNIHFYLLIVIFLLIPTILRMGVKHCPIYSSTSW